MSHNIHGYIAKHEDLLRVFGKSSPLPQGFGFVPNPENPNQEKIVANIELVAWVETNFFGGAGTQTAILWENGKVIYEKHGSYQSPVDDALKKMGVKKGDSDEFDALNLGHYRQDEDFEPLQEITSEERRALQKVWHQEHKSRPEQARTGDYVKLLVQWQDISGTITFCPGTIAKVLYPDLTTGGVLVEYKEVPFSLSPEEYEIMDVPYEP